MSFQPAIPGQGALRQSPPPLRRPKTILNNPRYRTMIFQRNSNNPLNFVSQSKGALRFAVLSFYPFVGLTPFSIRPYYRPLSPAGKTRRAVAPSQIRREG